MPLYLARGPATFAFLIQAEDRDHLDYIIDAMLDPGLFEAEVYDGPLTLMLSLPATFRDGPDDSAEPRVTYSGGTHDYDDLCSVPSVAPVPDFGDHWEHLRQLAFPNFHAAIERWAEDHDDGEVPRAVLEEAIAKDADEQQLRVDARERLEPNGFSPSRSALADASIESHKARRASREDIAKEGDTEPLDALDVPADSESTIAQAISRFGKVQMTATAKGILWQVGEPVVGEGPDLTQAMRDGAM